MKEVKALKNSMNKLRTDFQMPEHHQLQINAYWVLGFTEGEGSLSIDRNNYRLRFSIGQSTRDQFLMQELRKYFLGLAVAKNLNLSDTSGGGLYISSAKENRDLVSIDIRHRELIEDVLIPFFDQLDWLSKKSSDYQDFKTILKLTNLGAQYYEEGVEVLDLILSQMNSRRLSSNIAKKNGSNITPDLLKAKVDDLLKRPSCIEALEDGNLFIKPLNKIYNPRKGSCKVEIFDEEGNKINTLDSITACAKFLGVSNDVVSRTLIKKGKPFIKDCKKLRVKRVPIRLK